MPDLDERPTPASLGGGALTFFVMLEQDAADDWVVGARDLPEAQTSGATRDEALALAADAIAVAVARRTRDGDDLPQSSLGLRGEISVAPPLRIAAKAERYRRWRLAGFSS